MTTFLLGLAVGGLLVCGLVVLAWLDFIRGIHW
jgi:hypothetical protein